MTKHHHQTLLLHKAWEHHDWTMEHREKLSRRMKYDSTFNAKMAVFGYVVFHTICHFSLYNSSYKGSCGDIKLWGTSSRAFLELVLVVQRIMNVIDYLKTIAKHLLYYMISVFRNGNTVFVQDNTRCLC